MRKIALKVEGDNYIVLVDNKQLVLSWNQFYTEAYNYSCVSLDLNTELARSIEKDIRRNPGDLSEEEIQYMLMLFKQKLKI